MHRNRENHVAPQVSPDISLQTEEKKISKVWSARSPIGAPA